MEGVQVLGGYRTPICDLTLVVPQVEQVDAVSAIGNDPESNLCPLGRHESINSLLAGRFVLSVGCFHTPIFAESRVDFVEDRLGQHGCK
jgi:hypothetical protein